MTVPVSVIVTVESYEVIVDVVVIVWYEADGYTVVRVVRL